MHLCSDVCNLEINTHQYFVMYRSNYIILLVILNGKVAQSAGVVEYTDCSSAEG